MFFFSISLSVFCRVMWIIINVNPNRMHIFLFNCLGLLYLFSFGGWAWGCCYPETAKIRIEIYIFVIDC